MGPNGGERSSLESRVLQTAESLARVRGTTTRDGAAQSPRRDGPAREQETDFHLIGGAAHVDSLQQLTLLRLTH